MINQLTSNLTVNFDSSMTTAQIQTKINALPKNLNGFTLTFQFADGTYNLTSTLKIYDFSLGKINIYGNMTENKEVKHSNQAVHLNFSSGFVDVVNCQKVECSNLKVTTSVAGANYGLAFAFCDTECYGNYVVSDNITSAHGIHIYHGCANINFNYITKYAYGITSSISFIQSKDNAELTNSPQNGLLANGGYISKFLTQPVGTVTNELLLAGGLIPSPVIQSITASDPPTQAELVAALGAASLYPSRSLLVSSTGGSVYTISSNGTSWFYNAFTVGA